MTDDPRDALDDALTRGLGSLAPSESQFDADATLTGMRPRLERARLHHRITIAGSTLAIVAILLAGTAVLTNRSEGSSKIETPTASSVPDDTTTRPTTTTTRPSTATTPSTTPGVTTPTSTPASTPDSTPGSTPSGGLTPGATPGTAPAPVAPTTKTYTTVGGSAVIRLQDPNVTLVSYSPAAGYSAIVDKSGPDEVDVRFTNGENEARIRVRFHDGQLEEETED
jgi:hypothetical protein